MGDGILFYQVDAFTNEPFRVNPAAVCLLQRQYDDKVLQSIAAEMNLSETAFLRNKTEEPCHRTVFVEDRQLQDCP